MLIEPVPYIAALGAVVLGDKEVSFWEEQLFDVGPVYGLGPDRLFFALHRETQVAALGEDTGGVLGTCLYRMHSLGLLQGLIKGAQCASAGSQGATPVQVLPGEPALEEEPSWAGQLHSFRTLRKEMHPPELTPVTIRSDGFHLSARVALPAGEVRLLLPRCGPPSAADAERVGAVLVTLFAATGGSAPLESTAKQAVAWLRDGCEVVSLWEPEPLVWLEVRVRETPSAST